MKNLILEDDLVLNDIMYQPMMNYVGCFGRFTIIIDEFETILTIIVLKMKFWFLMQVLVILSFDDLGDNESIDDYGLLLQAVTEIPHIVRHYILRIQRMIYHAERHFQFAVLKIK